MPKKVDHEERRREIALAAGRIASRRGLQGLSFREVAAEAGISVALVQHYFGTKENLLVTTLDVHSAAMAAIVGERVAALGPEAGPLPRVRAMVGAFLGTDRRTRATMRLYHAYGAAALTDAALRRAEAFRNETVLVGYLAEELERARGDGELDAAIEPEVEARTLVALVLGLSLGVLLGRTAADEAHAALDAHFSGLQPRRRGRRD